MQRNARGAASRRCATRPPSGDGPPDGGDPAKYAACGLRFTHRLGAASWFPRVVVVVLDHLWIAPSSRNTSSIAGYVSRGSSNSARTRSYMSARMTTHSNCDRVSVTRIGSPCSRALRCSVLRLTVGFITGLSDEAGIAASGNSGADDGVHPKSDAAEAGRVGHVRNAPVRGGFGLPNQFG